MNAYKSIVLRFTAPDNPRSRCRQRLDARREQIVAFDATGITTAVTINR